MYCTRDGVSTIMGSWLLKMERQDMIQGLLGKPEHGHSAGHLNSRRLVGRRRKKALDAPQHAGIFTFPV